MRFPRQKPATTASRFGPVILEAVLLAWCARVCGAQPPVQTAISEPWRTLDTEHFRIHYRPQAATFARSVAARVEAVRAEVGRLVGHFPDPKVDVIIGEPQAEASAQGLPFREGPRVLLHAAPPASSSLEDFDDWIAVSLGYELAHVAHLSRPPENRALSWLSRTLPVTSLVAQLPGWVPAAYAASIADRLPCAGVPRRPLAAALLRRQAASGRLPALDRLSGDAEWPHLALDEMVGAPFLAWLEARPRGSLPEVWRRMTASAPRTFRGSVDRTFGAPIGRLYSEWQREIAARAAIAPAPAARGIAIDAMSAPDEGADGAIVVMARRHHARPRLTVLDRDFRVLDFLDLEAADSDTQPRWLADGSVVFVRNVSGGGEAASDLYRWWPETERLERVTHGAVLRAVDDAGGGSVVAVENRWGQSALVRVSLESAAVETLIAAAADTVLDSPRLSPDGRRLAYLRHRGAGWRLVVRELGSGNERELGEPGLRVLSWPAWTPDGAWIVVTVADRDSVRLEAWAVDGNGPGGRRLLNPPGEIAMGAGFDGGGAPPRPDREPALVYLALSAGPAGVSLVRQPWPREAPASLPVLQRVDSTSAVRSTACAAVAAPTGPDRPYGHGPTTYSSLLAGGYSPSGHNVVGGWRGGDVIGRWEAVAITSAAADGAETGGIVSGAWRGGRYPVQFHGYAVERRPSRQPENVPGLGESLDVIERGFALETGWRRDQPRRALALGAVAMAEKLSPRGGSTVERYALQLRGDAEWTLDLRPAARLRLGAGAASTTGWTDSHPWRRYGGELRGGLALALGRRIYAVDGSWSELRVDGPRLIHDRLILGGAATSLVPPRFDLGRLYEAALPAGTLIGDRWESQRLSLSHEGTPARLFFARHRLWSAGAAPAGWLRLTGIEVTLDRDARPVYRLPSSAVRLGAAYLLDPPFRHRRMIWAGLAWTL
jgi:hypothetical protein